MHEHVQWRLLNNNTCHLKIAHACYSDPTCTIGFNLISFFSRSPIQLKFCDRLIDLEAYQFDHTAVKNSQHQKNKFSKQNHSKFEKIVREEYSFTLNQRINVKSATKAEIS